MNKIIKTSKGNISATLLGLEHNVPLVFLHGGPGMSSSYLMDSLSSLKEKYKLVFFDQLGCGKSDIPPTLSIDSLVESSAEVINNLVNVPNYYVISHSWSSFLIMDMLDKKLLKKQPLKIAFCNPAPFDTQNFNNIGAKLFGRIPEKDVKEIEKLELLATDLAGEDLMKIALPYYSGRNDDLPNLKMEYRIPTYNSIVNSQSTFDFTKAVKKIIKDCYFVFGDTDYITIDDFNGIIDANSENYFVLKGGHFSFDDDKIHFISIIKKIIP
jgi:proline iminopeptidase